MIKVGFYKKNLYEALVPKQEVREPIEAVVLYIEDEEKSSVWIVLDFMDFNRGYTDGIKSEVSKRLLLSVDMIHIVTTHNHGGGDPEPCILSSLVADAAELAKAAKKEALMRYSFTETDTQKNIKRRLFVPEIGGKATLYFGASEKNDFNASLFRENVVTKMKEGRECNSMGTETSLDYERFPEADKEIAVIQFATPEGEVIGSIVRYAAHAVTANRPGSYSSDYPYYVRAGMEEKFGGVCMFLNGPCGEIAPAMINKLEGVERVLGGYLAECAAGAVSKEKFEKIESFISEKYEVKLPVREELLKNKVEIPEKMPDDLKERRIFLEKKRLEHTLPFLNEKYSVGEEKLDEDISIFLGALSLGDLTILAFPGETFNETASKVKSEFPSDKIITVTEHERTVMYIPPEAELTLGGYETVCRVTGSGAEKRLYDSAKNFYKLIKEKK